MFDDTLNSINKALTEGITTEVEFSRKTLVDMGAVLVITAILVIIAYFSIRGIADTLKKN